MSVLPEWVSAALDQAAGLEEPGESLWGTEEGFKSREMNKPGIILCSCTNIVTIQMEV